jgi:hypothetical protein
MADLTRLTDRSAVESAISEFRQIGRKTFLEKYGFGFAKSYFLIDRGEIFDSKAIVGAAYQYQTGIPLDNERFSGGESGAIPALKRLGFRIERTKEWLNAVTAEEIQVEIDEFRRIGREAYLHAYGGGEANKFFINDNDERIDAKAILVCAMRRATGHQTITHNEVESTEKGVAQPLIALGFDVNVDWPFAPGQTTTRKMVHNKVGGNRQKGITAIEGSKDVLIFSDPVSGREYGYDRFEGFREDGSFWYTGEGTLGNQVIDQYGNKTLMESDLNQTRLRLFMTQSVNATYVGEVVLGDPPFEWKRAPDKEGNERDIVVFHLVPVTKMKPPVTAVPTPLISTAWTPPADGNYTITGTVVNGRNVSRQEMKLQGRYGTWLQDQGNTVLRRPVLVPSTGVQVFPDLYNATTKTVVEAKKSASREYVREAIGQVLDYKNLLEMEGEEGINAAILLPGLPEPDLVFLCAGLAIEVIIPDGNGFTNSRD